MEAELPRAGIQLFIIQRKAFCTIFSFQVGGELIFFRSMKIKKLGRNWLELIDICKSLRKLDVILWFNWCTNDIWSPIVINFLSWCEMGIWELQVG